MRPNLFRYPSIPEALFFILAWGILVAVQAVTVGILAGARGVGRWIWTK